jgi:hypothetical protein
MIGLLVCCVAVTSDGGAWSPAEPIEETQDESPGNAQVAMDASGTAVVVWHWGMFGSIRSRHHTPGDGWSPVQQIDNNGEAAFWPALAVDPNGNAVAVWIEEVPVPPASHKNEIWANRYAPDDGWGTATRLDTDEAGDGSGPHVDVAVDPAGNAVAVWHQSDGIRENIWASRSTLGDDWSVPQLIERDNAGHAGDPRVAMDSGGDAIAVWHQSDGTRANIWANRYSSSNGWGNARLIERNDQGEARLPDVAMDPGGNATVVWHQSDGMRFDIWSNRYTAATGEWGTAELIEDDDTGDADSAEVGLDADGHATAAWKQFDGITTGVWANRYTPGDGWGTAKRIESNDVGDALRPRLAVNANGDAVVVWLQSDGSRLNVWSNSYTPSEDWSTALPIELSSEDEGQVRDPAVAMDPNGRAVAVWGIEGPTTIGTREGSIWATGREQ